MKKFYSFLFAAVALVGFAACNSDSTEEPAPAQQVGKMEFTANIGEDTKTQLTTGGKVKWDANDAIVVSNGTDVKQYTIIEGTLSTDGKTATFEGEKMDGDTFYAAYPCPKDEKGNVDLTNVKCNAGAWTGIAEPIKQTATVGSFANNAAVSLGTYLGDGKFSFTNESAILKFQVPENCSFVQFYNGSNLAVELNGGLTAGETYYATVAPGEYTFTVRIDACPSKTSTKKLLLARNTIYNLGTLPAKQTKTVYLVPGIWASDNADFAVYYWNGKSNNDLLMTKDETKSGVYKAEVAADAEGIIFKRLNPTDHKIEWSKTADLKLPADEKDHYYVTDWAAGEWREYVQIEWALAGTFNNWEDMPMTRKDAVISVAEGVNLKAYDQFKVKDATTWDTNYGAGFSNMNPGHYMAVTYNGGEIAITAAGTYDIYFDEVNTLVYVVTAGSDYKTAIEQTENGPAPVTGNIYYFKPNSNWTQSNAKFSGHFWNGSGTKWAELTDTDKDGIYECNLGEWVPTNVIFLRKDPNGFVYNNWTCWNRIGNIKVPSDKNFYTMASGVTSQQIESGNGYTGGTWGTK